MAAVMHSVADRAQALEALADARAALEHVTTRFWRIKDDPAVPYDEVYQLHMAYQKAANAVVDLEARIMSQAIAPRPQDLAELDRIRQQLAQDVSNRAMVEAVVRLTVLLAGI